MANNKNHKIYSLSYDETAGISRLQSLDLLNGEGRKIVDPLVFNYGKKNPDSGDLSIPRIYNYNNGTGARKTNLGLIAIDMDGDGVCELGDIYSELDDIFAMEYNYLDVRKKSDSWTKQTQLSLGYMSLYGGKIDPYNIFSDFNLNGTADRILLSFSTHNMKMSLQAFDCSSGSNITQSTTLNLFSSLTLKTANSPFVCSGNAKGDAFGNILVILDEPVEERNHYKYSYQLLSGTSSGKVSLVNEEIKTFSTTSKIEKVLLMKLGTFNYRDDLLLFLEDGTTRIVINSQNNNELYSGRIASQPDLKISKDDPCKLGDINGDGLVDIVYRTNGNQWKIAYNKGSYSFEIKDLSMPSCDATTGLKEPNLIMHTEKDDVFLIDINQDGLTDLVFADERLKVKTPGQPSYTTYIFNETIWTFYLNTGQKNENFAYQFTKYSSEKSGYACFGDLLGKGDLNWAHADALGNMLITTFDFPRNPTLLSSISNPVSGESKLEYAPHIECDLENSDSYTLSNYLNMKSHPFKSSRFNVLAKSDDGNTQITYRYSKPVINWAYRGFLGFRFHEKKNVKENLWEVTEYTFPSNGSNYYLMLAAIKKIYGKKGNTTILTKSENYTYSIKSYRDYNNNATQRHAVGLATHTQNGYLAGEKTKIKSSYTVYDDYHNIVEAIIEAKGQTDWSLYGYQKSGSWYSNKPRFIIKRLICAEDDSYIERASTFRFDSRGNMTESKIDSGDVNMRHIRYKNYDYYGRPLRIEEEANGILKYSTTMYTSSGRFISKETNMFNQSVSYIWDEQKGLLTSSSDRKGTTSYRYNDFGQIESITHPTGVVESQESKWAEANSGFRYYTKQSRPDMPGKTVWTYYDKYGREVAQDTYDANNSGRILRMHTEYYPHGSAYRVSHPGHIGQTVQWAATHYYDDLKRLIRTVTPEGSTNVVYSISEDTMMVTKPDGITTTTIWNTNGQVSKLLTNGKAVEYTYTAGDRLKTAKPEGGNSAWQMEYDLQGNLIKQKGPDLGTIEYAYNGWGDVIWEKQKIHNSGLTVSTSYNYDIYGYLQTKVRGNETTRYEYDSFKRLKKVSILGGHSRYYEYNTHDHPTLIENVIKGKTYQTRNTYDSYGRVETISYPSSYSVTNHYDSYGYMRSVTDNSSRLIWQLDSCDAQGQVLKETKNNISTRYTYDKAGHLLSIKTPEIMNTHYTYYPTGNLKSYTDSIYHQTEKYSYDKMDRLVDWSTPEERYPWYKIEYQNTANRISSQFHYQGGHDYFYFYKTSNELEMLTYASLPIQNFTYTDFKKVKSLHQGTEDFFTIDYGVDEQRIYMSDNSEYGTEHYYVGNYEEKTTQDGRYIFRIHYIYGGNGLAAIYKTFEKSGDFYSAYTDRQGSLVALAQGKTVAQRYSYDPWGNRRDPASWLQPTNVHPDDLIINRGYTMHEHLDAFGLINMNGRMYEPYSGIFLSPDPYIQSPGNWLNYNRYAYCLNNPLKYTDPTGEWFLIDDLIVSAVGFVGGYVGHGIMTGNWGWDAIASGGIGAATSWLGYNTMGATSGWQFAANSIANTAIGFVVPPINFSIGNVDFSINPMAMFTAGTMGNINGFSLGMGISASYDIGDWTLRVGSGPSSLFGGVSYDDGSFGFSWHTTKYNSGIDGTGSGQRTATVGLRYKDWSISHENDVAIMGGDGGDRFRSAALEVGYKDWVLGANVYTNQVDRNDFDQETNTYNKGTQYSSPLYIGKRTGHGMIKIGVEHQAIGDKFQNGFHSLIDVPYFKQSTVVPYTPYIKAGRYNPFSKYY